MQKVKTSFVSVNKGDIIKGKITKLTPSEILVDINAKTEAIVLEKDKRILRNLLASLKVGDEVSVQVLNPESDTGNPVVSLRRFIDDRLWSDLFEKQKSQALIDVVAQEVTRGGFLIQTKTGLSGFLPNSQTTNVSSPQDIVGKTIPAYILELDRKDNKIIFSQRPLLSDEDFKKAVKNIKIGQSTKAVVTAVTPFGLFVSIQPKADRALAEKAIDGLVHVSEIAWERTEDIGAEFSVGQKIETVAIRIDYETKRVDLSIKRLTKDPFEEITKQYTVDKKVKGTVTRVLTTGVALSIIDADVKEGIEGFIRKEKIPPTVTYEAGSTVDATVLEVDKRRHRLILVPVLKEKPIGYR